MAAATALFEAKDEVLLLLLEKTRYNDGKHVLNPCCLQLYSLRFDC